MSTPVFRFFRFCQHLPRRLKVGGRDLATDDAGQLLLASGDIQCRYLRIGPVLPHLLTDQQMLMPPWRQSVPDGSRTKSADFLPAAAAEPHFLRGAAADAGVDFVENQGVDIVHTGHH